VEVTAEENRLGGAANVAWNLHALGVQPLLCGVVGTDVEGESFLELLQQAGLSTQGVLATPLRRTTTKVRVLGNRQQMLRVDKEDRQPLPQAVATQFAQRVQQLMAQTQPHGIIFEDYDKGLLSPPLIAQWVQQANALGIPTFVDPKFRNFLAYSHVTVFKPNLKELREGMKAAADARNVPGLVQLVQQLRQQMPHTYTLLTLSEHGVLLLDEALTPHATPAHYRNITDVSGAGDTVISVMAACMAAGLPAPLAAQAANLAGGLVCEEVGVVPIRPEKLLPELRTLLGA
jgi:rfaE bifunctional protein kinase chain/domain